MRLSSATILALLVNAIAIGAAPVSGSSHPPPVVPHPPPVVPHPASGSSQHPPGSSQHPPGSSQHPPGSSENPLWRGDHHLWKDHSLGTPIWSEEFPPPASHPLGSRYPSRTQLPGPMEGLDGLTDDEREELIAAVCAKKCSKTPDVPQASCEQQCHSDLATKLRSREYEDIVKNARKKCSSQSDHKKCMKEEIEKALMEIEVSVGDSRKRKGSTDSADPPGGSQPHLSGPGVPPKKQRTI